MTNLEKEQEEEIVKAIDAIQTDVYFQKLDELRVAYERKNHGEAREIFTAAMEIMKADLVIELRKFYTEGYNRGRGTIGEEVASIIKSADFAKDSGYCGGCEVYKRNLKKLLT